MDSLAQLLDIIDDGFSVELRLVNATDYRLTFWHDSRDNPTNIGVSGDNINDLIRRAHTIYKQLN